MAQNILKFTGQLSTRKSYSSPIVNNAMFKNFSVYDSIERSTVWSVCSCLILLAVENKIEVIKIHILANAYHYKLLADFWHFS